MADVLIANTSFATSLKDGSQVIVRAWSTLVDGDHELVGRFPGSFERVAPNLPPFSTVPGAVTRDQPAEAAPAKRGPGRPRKNPVTE